MYTKSPYSNLSRQGRGAERTGFTIMIWILFAGIFAFGLVAGSFLNVCIYRLPTGKSLIKPGSFCPVCKNDIRFYDNIPVLSYLILMGKCRHCGEKISIRYPAVEVLTGLLLVWLAYAVLGSGMSALVLGAYVYLTLGLIVITFVDAEHEIIPDEISLIGIPVSFIVSLFIPDLHAGVYPFSGMFKNLPDFINSGVSSLAGIAVGGGSLWLVGYIGKLILKKDAMGFGDVKLMATVGGFIGWINVLIAIFIACGIGSVIGVAVLIKTKSRRIPFGPFLAVGTFLMMLYNRQIIFFLTDTYPKFVRNVLGMD